MRDREPIRMLSQVFLARFEPVVTRFGPWKIPKCFENVAVLEREMGPESVKNTFFQN